MSRLKKKYNDEVKKTLMEKFNYKNVMLVPQLNKVVISMGLAEASKDKNSMQDCFNELMLISGQKPVFRKSKKAVSNFKLREDQNIGLKVTLRGKRMYDFVDRFVNIIAPRIRDFRGFKTGLDGRGSYSLGLEDQQMFPEINLDTVKRSQGMNIAFVTTAQNDTEGFALLKELGMPFKKEGE
ncbi:MAG: 50S ribosomal protein L5 [Chlamydiia bacterium]|nr:50S ribosomal protein L5 [Chlamydiia bacterium]MCP5509298.1 50S ribosomal protein L5 [Chlamydiales bacterium]